MICQCYYLFSVIKTITLHLSEKTIANTLLSLVNLYNCIAGYSLSLRTKCSLIINIFILNHQLWGTHLQKLYCFFPVCFHLAMISATVLQTRKFSFKAGMGLAIVFVLITYKTCFHNRAFLLDILYSDIVIIAVFRLILDLYSHYFKLDWIGYWEYSALFRINYVAVFLHKFA
jgi:hypothetical protein